MNQCISYSAFVTRRALIIIAIAVLLTAGAWASSAHWWQMVASRNNADARAHDGNGNDDHADGHHDHSSHADENSIKISENGLKNIGYEPVTVSLGTFERTVTIPAIVVEQSGRTQIHITSPVTGIVTEIHAFSGEAVEPDSPMFELRLTHEEVVSAQREYLLTSESLDIVNREIERLESAGQGVVPGRVVLEKQYEKQKLEASLLAGEQTLMLHGLRPEEIAEIRNTKQLIQTHTIRAPDHSHNDSHCKDDHLFHAQRISVSQGQQVQAGEELCVLADHCELLIEGRAFEDDAKSLRNAVREGWNVSARLLSGNPQAEYERSGDGQGENVERLRLLYLADHIDPESRAFHFYLALPNQVVLDQKSANGRRFIEWRYKPGQRMELRVPLEQWADCIVLPASAVVEDGPEAYVYRQSGTRFDRIPVHVEYRDRNSVVIANDGSIGPGEVVAGEGAYQIHLAVQNKAGGGIDPHAGHQH
ncbi:MAG TPA: efflux RND transporter periplasmic adaptor subunit [Lacipirellulaceae bacterium]|nr:efflux RND transporter periplasmic adaptor subunit [Lacipirellulaceae bacterium]